MHREEVLIGLDHSGKPTPNRKEILSIVAKEVKAKEDIIIIDKIFNKTGKSASEARVFVYKKPGDVPKYKIEKMKRRLEKKEKPVPKPEAKPEEKPAPKPVAEEAEEQPVEEEKPEAKESEK